MRTRTRRVLETFAGGSISSALSIAATAAVGVFVPGIHVTWLFATLWFPCNALLMTAYMLRKRRTAERLKLAPARVLQSRNQARAAPEGSHSPEKMLHLLVTTAEHEQTSDEAAAELLADGVDVEQFIERVHRAMRDQRSKDHNEETKC